MDAGGSQRERGFRVRSSEAKLLHKCLVQGSCSHDVLAAHTLCGGQRERGNGTTGDTHTTKEHGDLTPHSIQRMDVLLLIPSTHSNTCTLPFMPNIALRVIFWGQLVRAHLWKKIVFLWNMSRKCALYHLSTARADLSYTECQSSNPRGWARTLLLGLSAHDCPDRIWGNRCSGACHPWCPVDPKHGFPPTPCVFFSLGLGKWWAGEWHCQAR